MNSFYFKWFLSYQYLVREALEKIGLEKYCQLFENEEIDFKSFVELSDDNLRDLEVPTGSRIKILKIAKSLRECDEDKGLNLNIFSLATIQICCIITGCL